jgi:hypothetical protein
MRVEQEGDRDGEKDPRYVPKIHVGSPHLYFKTCLGKVHRSSLRHHMPAWQ